MAWVAVAVGGASLVGSLVQGSTAKKNAGIAQENSQADREANAKMWADTVQANRPTQNTPWGQSSWAQDAKGNWTQNQTLNPAEQSRLDDYRQMAANRMHAANQIDVSAPKPIQYNAPGGLAAIQNVGTGGAMGLGMGGFNPFQGSGPPQGAYLQQGGGQPQQPQGGGSAGGMALGTPGNPAPINTQPTPPAAPAAPAATPIPAPTDPNDTPWAKYYAEQQAKQLWEQQLQNNQNTGGQ